MQLPLGLVVLVDVIEILALRHALQRQRRSRRRAPWNKRPRAADMGVPDAERAVELARERRSPDGGKRIDELSRRAGDVLDLSDVAGLHGRLLRVAMIGVRPRPLLRGGACGSRS